MNEVNFLFLSIFTLNQRLNFFDMDAIKHSYFRLLDKFQDQGQNIANDGFFTISVLFSLSNLSLLEDKHFVMGHSINVMTFLKWNAEVFGGTTKNQMRSYIRILENLSRYVLELQ